MIRAMRRVLQITGAAVALLLASPHISASDDNSKLPPLWKLIAQSHAIVVGTPVVPVDQFEPATRIGHGRYIDFDTAVQQCLKGDACPETMTTRYYIYTDAHEAQIDHAVISANGTSSALFLVAEEGGNAGHEAYYLAGYTAAAVQPATPELMAAIKHEVAAQQEILRRFGENFPAAKEPQYAEVKSLVDATPSLWPWRQRRAFTKLEELGQAAVPPMIMLMDDRRELRIKQISLTNPPGGFEAIRHYGPEVVADAIAAILNQITGEDFGSIYNGGSERQRRATTDGWRIYLHRTRFGTETPNPHGAPNSS